MAEPLLRSDALTRRFGGLTAVNGVSLDLHVGEVHAVIGTNGAGKSTLINMLSGELPASDGTIEFDGHDIGGWSQPRRARAGVGRSYQRTTIFPSFSVLENCRLSAQAALPRAWAVWESAQRCTRSLDAAHRALAAAGLADAATRPAGLLSHGGQRQLEIAMCLATAPRVLLLDEPLAGLAAAERERVGQLIKGISRDLPVLLVEHDIDRVFALADAVTVMNDGEVLVDGTVAEARGSARVQEVYIGAGTHALAGRALEGHPADKVLLALSGVNTFYGKSHILRDVALDVRDREIVALLGRNGAGKSTLLKTVIGITPPATGSVTLAGEELARRPSAQIARRGIGYVPQGRGLFAGMSVAHNLELGRLKRRGGNGTFWEEERILAAFPRLKERWRSPADYLSGGEQQMLAVARALAGDTRLLLLDEPFEGLAPAVVEELFESFHQLRGEVSILIVDHHLDLVLALSDRTVALERGEVTHIGPSRALASDIELRRRVLWV